MNLWKTILLFFLKIFSKNFTFFNFIFAPTDSKLPKHLKSLTHAYVGSLYYWFYDFYFLSRFLTTDTNTPRTYFYIDYNSATSIYVSGHIADFLSGLSRPYPLVTRRKSTCPQNLIYCLNTKAVTCDAHFKNVQLLYDRNSGYFNFSSIFWATVMKLICLNFLHHHHLSKIDTQWKPQGKINGYIKHLHSQSTNP